MSDNTDNEPNKAERDKLIRQKMEARDLDPDNAEQRARFERGQKLVDTDRWNETELRREIDRMVAEQGDKQLRAAARARQVEVGLIPAEQKRDDSPRPERGTGNWRDRLQQGFAGQIPSLDRQSPHTQRNQIRLSAPDTENEPEGPQQEKKQIEVDWRLALTDPAYRRQAREQDRSEQKEKSGEQRQVQGPQLSPGR